MRHAIILMTTIFMSAVCASALAQDRLEPAQPVVILSPGHGDFVIPPFWIDARAEPGEELGLFVNGYPHTAVKADARGRVLERVAWSHGGPVWVELRRGDNRRHAVRLRIAQVTPAVGSRVLAAAAPTLLAVNEAGPGRLDDASRKREGEPVLLPATTARESAQVGSSASANVGWDRSPNHLQQFSRPFRDTSSVQAHAVSITAGLVSQFLGVVAVSGALGGPENESKALTPLLGVAMVGQSALTYFVHSAMGNDPDMLQALLGALVPTAVAALGMATDSTALIGAGLAAQPIGASFGATF
jgi:hypothetical protein